MTTAARSHPPHKAILIGPTSLHIVGHAGAFTGTDLMGVAFFLTLEKSFHRGSKMKEFRNPVAASKIERCVDEILR